MSKKVVIALLLLLFAMEVLAQDYELNIIQRRKYDQIHAEIWVKSIAPNPSIIGDAQIWLEYNKDYLIPNTNTTNGISDSISSDLSLTNPLIQINSQFNGLNGYTSLSALNNSTNIGIRARLLKMGDGGFRPSSSGKGDFLGKIIFDIKNNPPLNSQTGIKVLLSNPASSVLDVAGTNITSKVSIKQPSNFTIIGVTLLSPIFSNQIIDRDKKYGALANSYKGVGYPIYFERSVNPQTNPGPVSGNTAYVVEYNNGAWTEIGRLAEHNNQGLGSSAFYRSGDIARPSQVGTYVLTSAAGQPLGNSNFRNPVRVLWAKPTQIKERNSQVKLRITMLSGTIDSIITKREKSNFSSESPTTQAMGVYFTSLLNGSNEYFKSQNTFSNPTQLTIEAWVNPTKYNSGDVGLVVSSGGPNQAEIFGKKEGAWMLYLKDGKYPAFKARENQNNGNDGYLVNLIAEDALSIKQYSDKEDDFSRNWTHIAAVLKNSVAYLYVDGELVASDEINKDENYRLLITDHPIWIGVNPNEKLDSKSFFAGGIKEIKVWRSAFEQDSIRKYASGLESPESIDPLLLPDSRTGLDLYYKLNDEKIDYASNSEYQNGANNLDFYRANQVSDNATFVPDLPHLKITSPNAGVGMVLQSGLNYPIRYLTYNIGNSEKRFSKDVYVEVSTNNGASWIQAENSIGTKLGGNFAVDAEDTKATWEPFQSNDAGAGLRDALPYSKKVLMRITGHEDYNQRAISNITGEFIISRDLALSKSKSTIIYTDSSKTFLPSEKGIFVETWVRPYRFPTLVEKQFPILSMVDSATGKVNYSLSLLENGTFEFSYTKSDSSLVKIVSDSNYKILEPISYTVDSAWTHIAFYFNPYETKFPYKLWIDGIENNLNYKLSEIVDSNYDSLNSNRLYIGYYPIVKDAKASLGFEGEIKELRFWKGFPINKSYENGDLTQFIQGALTIQIDKIKRADTLNLINSFSFNGGMFHKDGKIRVIPASIDTNFVLNFSGPTPHFVGVVPYIRLVEPTAYSIFKQNNKNLRLRWVGFGLDNNGFTSGQRFGNPPSLEFSEKGGSGNNIVPYKFVGSNYWAGNSRNSFSVPDSAKYRFKEFGSNVYYAASLDVSTANPDINKDNINLDQGALPIVKDNMRFRLNARYVLENQNFLLSSESPLYSVIPGENFTLRVLLEGRHNGRSFPIDQIKAGYDNGGFKVSLFENVNGKPGNKVGEAENFAGYEELNAFNQNSGSNNFSNLGFLFPDLTTGEYWLLVEQKNHLPVMSRFPVTFVYEGDDKKSWVIESGWDFTSWNGVRNNVLISKSENAWEKFRYTALGNSEPSKDSTNWTKTGLNYNDGKTGLNSAPFAALVGGDVNQDGYINSIDIDEILNNTYGTEVGYDLNGDSIVNAFDRGLVFRNIGKMQSLGDFAYIMYGESATFIPSIKGNELIPNSEKVKIITNTSLLSSISYEITSKTTVKDSTATLEFFIKSNGASFKLGNSSFAFIYDTLGLEYIDYNNTGVVFSNKSGYLASFSAPNPEIVNSYKNIRTIEIVLPENVNGIDVPTQLTSLGKFSFKIKSKDAIIQFKWHKSTIIYNNDLSNISSFAIKDDIEPIKQFKIELLNPNGSKNYATEQTLEIKWSNEGNPIQLEYFNGTNWQKITQDVFSSTITKYNWVLPSAEVKNARVRLIDAQLQIELVKSDPFNIERRFGQIISPSENDGIFKGGELISVYYSTSGYDKIDIEYSTDGGDTWSIIRKNADAKAEKYQWTLPKLSSNIFYIRIISGADIIDISDRMRVLNGELDLIYPNSTTVFEGGTTERIRWTSSGVGKFTLQFSLDAGDNWLDIAKNLNASARYYNWSIPNISSSAVMIRAIWSDDPEMLYDATPLFTISVSTSTELQQETNNSFKLLNNTTINNFTEISSQKNSINSVKIFDLNGKIVSEFEYNFRIGNNKLELGNIEVGVFFILIEDRDGQFFEKIIKL